MDRARAQNDPPDPAGSGGQPGGGGPTSLVRRAKDLAVRFLDIVPGAHRLLRELARVEVIDRAVVIAAQSLFSVAPLLIVLGAFSPHVVGESLTHQIANVLGVDNSDTQSLENMATSEQVRTQTGIGSVFIVIISAMAFARALQRMYERVWELPHQGGLVGNKRCLFWLVSWIAYLQLFAVSSSALSAGDLTIVRVTLQIAISFAAWWWSARMLLLGRVGWAPLALGAVLTGISLSVLGHFSRVVMPPYVDASVQQFGALGLVFAASTWLLAFGAILVVAALIGRVYTEDLSIMRRIVATYSTRQGRPAAQPGASETDT